MRRSRLGRNLAIVAGALLLLALSFAMLGLAIRQGLVAPRNIDSQLGPFILVARGPGGPVCGQPGDPASGSCGRPSAAARPTFYRVSLFWYTPGRGTQSAVVLGIWTIPLPDQGRNGRSRPR